MFKRMLEYAGEYKNKAYAEILTLVASTIVNVAPYFFGYEIIVYLIGEKDISIQGLSVRIAGI